MIIVRGIQVLENNQISTRTCLHINQPFGSLKHHLILSQDLALGLTVPCHRLHLSAQCFLYLTSKECPCIAESFCRSEFMAFRSLHCITDFSPSWLWGCSKQFSLRSNHSPSTLKKIRNTYTRKTIYVYWAKAEPSISSNKQLLRFILLAFNYHPRI